MNNLSLPRLLIAGASGFIGKRFIAAWQHKYRITVLGRNREKLMKLFPTFTCLSWKNLSTLSPSDFDIVLNLSGETINHLRWTKKIKQKIIQSRIRASEELVNWLLTKPNLSLHFLQASALSIYGLYETVPTIINTETTGITPKSDFLWEVAQAWEGTLNPLLEQNFPVSILRFAVVLDVKAGAFPKLLSPAKWGLATRCGSGEQPFSWISAHDLVRAIDLVIKQKITGAINMVAPEIITQNQFNKILCTILKRPYFLGLPKFMVQLLFGDMGQELLLKGCAAKPAILNEQGFHFETPTSKEFFQQTVEK